MDGMISNTCTCSKVVQLFKHENALWLRNINLYQHFSTLLDMPRYLQGGPKLLGDERLLSGYPVSIHTLPAHQTIINRKSVSAQPVFTTLPSSRSIFSYSGYYRGRGGGPRGPRPAGIRQPGGYGPWVGSEYHVWFYRKNVSCLELFTDQYLFVACGSELSNSKIILMFQSCRPPLPPDMIYKSFDPLEVCCILWQNLGGCSSISLTCRVIAFSAYFGPCTTPSLWLF